MQYNVANVTKILSKSSEVAFKIDFTNKDEAIFYGKESSNKAPVLEITLDPK